MAEFLEVGFGGTRRINFQRPQIDNFASFQLVKTALQGLTKNCVVVFTKILYITILETLGAEGDL